VPWTESSSPHFEARHQDADARACAAVLELLETTRANVFLLRGGVLATPPLDGTILPGVTRAQLLERSHHAGITALELPLTLADLEAADAVLFTSSLRLLESSRVRPAAGPLLARLRELLRR